MKTLFPFALAAQLLACSSSDSTTPAAPDAGSTEAAAPTASPCTAARRQLLAPVAAVSTGEVKVVSTVGDVTTIYVDASAGGAFESAGKPRVYIKLSGVRVDLADEASYTSTEWDLALKRVDIFTNGGDAGPGRGGAVLVAKDFEAVSAADAPVTAAESFFDAACTGKTDAAGFLVTSFAGWYDYDQATNRPSPAKGKTFVVTSADGTRFKLAIDSFTGQPDGGTSSPATGYYLLRVARL